jgi:hypothetical protein
VTQRKGSPWWTGLWPFGIVVAFFLLGMWGHYINTAKNKAAPESEAPAAVVQQPPQSN